ncbi:MAG: signal peptidase II [Puniceicoccales bacterium]|jgi:signal peptidase II|nr:signal peptidase II [Puniceicoccales bacterium]
MRSFLKRSYGVFIMVFMCILLFDGITKYYVRLHASSLASEPIRLGCDRIRVTYTQNTGAAWSLFQGHNFGLALLGIIILLIIFWKRFQTIAVRPIVYGLLCGGILGNVIDRMCYGYVTDFIDIYLPFYHWPSFNIADSAICIAVCSLLFSTPHCTESRVA